MRAVSVSSGTAVPDTAPDRVAVALRDRVAPALGLGPDDLELVAFADGIASVRLSAACAGCAVSIPLLVAQVEDELRRHAPAVEIVEVVP